MNRSDCSWALICPGADVAFDSPVAALTEDVLLTFVTMMIVFLCYPDLLPHLQGFEQQGLGRIHDFDVVLVGA